jgi:S-adenosylmethionine synthetase
MQHKEIVVNIDYLRSKIEELIIPSVIKQNPALAYLFEDEDYELLVNPTGRFVIGGPEGDTGLTGRKIIVDTYGGKCPHGGGAFSGKDPSKVDRSAAYAARYIAKNLVAAGVSPEITVQLSYAIGMAEPLSIYVDTHGKGNYSNERIINVIKKVFPLKPHDIIEQLELKQPIYSKTATYGHFGRKEFRWEGLDKVNEIVENI